MTDLDMAANWLNTWFRGAPGYIHISSAGDWNGAAFDNTDGAIDDINRRSGQNPQGVYFRCCTLANRPAAGKRGGAEESFALPGLWSDIDFGDAGHKHAVGEDRLPLPPDEAAAWAVADRSGLPAPSVVVNSGGGLNAYWLLDQPYLIQDRYRHHVADLCATWQKVLGESARKLGFDYGTGVGDLARVLRMPGTDNRKTDTPRSCRIVWTTGAVYAIGELADIAAKLTPAAPAAGPRIEAPARPTTTTPHRSGGVGPLMSSQTSPGSPTSSNRPAGPTSDPTPTASGGYGRPTAAPRLLSTRRGPTSAASPCWWCTARTPGCLPAQAVT